MIGFSRDTNKTMMVAFIFMIATFTVSCNSKKINVGVGIEEDTPTQRVVNIVLSQSKDGDAEFRMESPLMKKYETKSKGYYEYFPDGIHIFGYNKEGLLETTIVSNEAKHEENMSGQEKWSAYGDVIILNHIKGEKIETDTLYWDQKEKKIFTDCYVKLTSPKGLMQGYGMESDEMARDAVLLKPFDSYGLIVEDTLKAPYRDTANFIGPIINK